MTREQKFNDYEAFVSKFETKRTTDDCMTPQPIYDAVRDWAVNEYRLQYADIVRPFYPNGDYEDMRQYPRYSVVLDNPPFSKLSKIVRFYNEHEIDYFLFAPHLTNFSIRNTNHVMVGYTITYENGAKVNTSFVTNLGDDFIRTAPDLYAKLKQAQHGKPEQPKYQYPRNILTTTSLDRLNKCGIDFRIPKTSCHFIQSLDAQKPQGKTIFGQGYIISDSVATELDQLKHSAEAKPIVWALSHNEKQIVKNLNGGEK